MLIKSSYDSLIEIPYSENITNSKTTMIANRTFIPSSSYLYFLFNFRLLELYTRSYLYKFSYIQQLLLEI